MSDSWKTYVIRSGSWSVCFLSKSQFRVESDVCLDNIGFVLWGRMTFISKTCCHSMAYWAAVMPTSESSISCSRSLSLRQ